MDSSSESWEGTNPSNTLISDLWPPEPWENTFLLFQPLFPVICYGSPGKPIHRVRPRESSAHIHWPKSAHMAPCNCKSGKQSLAACQESTCIHEPEDSLPSSKNQLPRGWAARTSQTHATGRIRLGHSRCCRRRNPEGATPIPNGKCLSLPAVDTAVLSRHLCPQHLASVTPAAQ